MLRSRPVKLGLDVEFTGWVSGTQRAELFGQTNLLVLPGIWPEPFGLAWIEAGGPWPDSD
jgi:glycosyltransferase involved in cell wall biosynthesis